MKFQREKITTSWDITKNVEGANSAPLPALLGLILLKMLYFVISKRPINFCRFFSFVKKSKFCNFLRRQWILFLNFSILSKMPNFVISKRPVDFFASSILSRMLNFVIFLRSRCVFFSGSSILSKILNFVILKSPVFFSLFRSILSKMLNFVIFW